MKTYQFTYKGRAITSRVPYGTFISRMASANRGGRRWTPEEAATTPRYSASERGRMAAQKAECQVVCVPRTEVASWMD